MKRILTVLILFHFIHLSAESAPACPASGTSVTWSSDSSWSSDTHGLGRTGKPVADDDVTIPTGEFMILDEAIPSLGNLIIHGTLQLDENGNTGSSGGGGGGGGGGNGNGNGNSNSNGGTEYTISVKKITISTTGRLIVGCENDPFDAVAIFSLRGEKSTTPNDKVIVVEGGLDLHGTNYSVQWTTLSSTTSNRLLSLTQTVTWPENDEVVIAPTGVKPSETEVLSIDSYTGGNMRLNASLSHSHLGESTTLTSSKVISEAAEVGHLSRKIKIVGEQYSDMFSDKFGARIHVASTGWARITNTEFYRTGEEQYPIDYSDPRFSILFSRISYSTSQPCYVKKSAFHDGFSPAIGIFDTPQIEISDNVIHHTVGSAIITNSSSTTLNHNLIVLVHWPGAFGRNADSNNNDYHGAIESLGASGLVLTNNSIAGIERACYHGEPELCSNAACSSSTWSGNICHTSLIGLALYPPDVVGGGFPGTHGWQYSGFTIYKCWDFGIYYNYRHSIKIQNNYLMDNGVSIFTMIYEPHLTNHDMTTSKSVLIDNCLLVGTSPHFDCSSDRQSNTDDNYKKSVNSRSWRGEKTSSNKLINYPAHTGIAWPSFTSGANNATWGPFIEPTQYNAISGKMEITNTEFAYFESLCSKETAAISTNPKNYDFQHPITIETATRTDSVDDDNLIYYHHPDKNKDGQTCNGILCDGLRKAILQDKDGSFLGSIGAAIPQAEQGWETSYDNKVASVKHPAGFTYNLTVLAQYKGVFRDGCTDKTQNSKWQGYFCGGNDWQYRVLVIESLDNDTETRTGAPLTLLGWTDSGAGVVDLVSGPNYEEVTDWTSDPISEKTYKIATYHAVVALGRNYSLYFNGVPPQLIRYHLLNADASDGIRLGTYYSMPNHLDVYHNDAYKDPMNDNQAADTNLDLQFNDPLSQYLPNSTVNNAGDNYLDREWNMTQIVIKGSGIVEVALTPAIVMTFNVPNTRATDGSFENDLSNQIRTIAQTAESSIAANNIRTANVQTNADNTTTTWWIEISDVICSTLSTCPGSVTQYTKEQYDALAVALFDSYQLDLFASSLQINEGVWGAEALPRIISDEAKDWGTATKSSYTYFKMLRIPRTLAIYEAPVAEYENENFTTQPKIHLVNANGAHVDVLGASPQSWYCIATYQSGSGTYGFQALNGTTNITFVDGWANFTDLSFYHFGTNYIIDFHVSIPTNNDFNVSTSPMTVLPRPLKIKLASATTVLQNQALNVEVEIWDSSQNSKVTDLTWNGNHFYVNVSLSPYSDGVYEGTWSGTTTAEFTDYTTGLATLSNFVLDSVGLIFFDINVYSNLTDYNLTSEMIIYVYPASHAYLTFPTSVTMTMKFEINYSTYGNLPFAAMVYTYLSKKYPNSQISNIVVTEGSVLITFTISGTSSVIDSVIQGTCDNIIEGKNLDYQGTKIPLAKSLSKNNETYYGVHCGPPDYTTVKIALIVGIVVGVIVLLVIIAFVYWKVKYRPRDKTHQSEDGSTTIKSQYGNAYMVERKIGRQNTFNSLSSLISDSPSPVPAPVKVNPKARRLGVMKQGSKKNGGVSSENKDRNISGVKDRGRTTRTRHF